jgi:aminopeptidase N
MKITSTWTILLFLSIQSFAQQFNCRTYDANQVTAFRQNQLLNTGADYDVIYHRCEWQVDPAVQGLTGKVTTYFSAITIVNTVEFDLMDTLTVDSVTEQNATVSFTHTNNILSINLNNTLSTGQVDSVSIYYHGIPPNTGFGSFFYSSHNGIPLLGTLSEPYGARDWWPCKQTTYDKVDSADILITCPSNNLAASNGKLISAISAGGNSTFHWQTRYPMTTYLFALCVSEYAQYHDTLMLQGGDTLDILNYVYRSDSAVSVTQSPAILDIISLYDSLFIEYPFKKEKYGHCQWTWGGGEEHQTMSFVSDLNFQLIAHECAHQWFGDYITCGSYEDIWLNEGFATYLEALCEQFIQGSVPWENWKMVVRSDITALPDGSVLCTDTTDLNRLFDYRLTYEKGAFVNHMLRWELGDSAYFTGLQQYLHDSTLAYGFAKTPDLKAHLENASGLNLTTFFDQWYYNQGFPTYDVQWNYQSGVASVQINQTQSDPSVNFFKMHVPIKFQGATSDTIVVFDHNFSGEIFTFPLSFNPTLVVFDPEIWILSNNNTVTFNTSIDVQSLLSNDEFIVYPNPASEKIFIRNKNIAGKTTVELFNNIGQNVFEKELVFEINSANEIDISALPSGIYSMTISNGHSRFTSRVNKN